MNITIFKKFKSRSELTKYLSGSGIEIGALQIPLDIKNSNIKSVKYVDRFDNDTLRKHYPELAGLNLVRPDIIDNGEELQSLGNETLDFIIANHFIEHTQNPIGTILNWYSKLKVGGYIFIAVPDKNKTFDKDREITSLKHLIDDNKCSKSILKIKNFNHFYEWVRFVQKKDGEELENSYNKLVSIDYSIHFHVFDFSSFVKMLNYISNNLKTNLKIVDYSNTEEKSNEFILILKKY